MNFNSSRLTRSYGRNGSMNTVGLDLFFLEDLDSSQQHDVEISPLTTRGASSTYLRLPFEDIPELIKTLEAFYHKHK